MFTGNEKMAAMLALSLRIAGQKKPHPNSDVIRRLEEKPRVEAPLHRPTIAGHRGAGGFGSSWDRRRLHADQRAHGNRPT